jgi:hypothetical protein
LGELRFHTSGFVGKRQGLTPPRVNVEQALAVFAGLFFDAGQCVAFGFRFDVTDGFAIDENR